MSFPTSTNEFIARARKMLGKGTIYKLGQGGLNPVAEFAYDNQKGLNCSGFVAWCMGISRYTTNTFYVEMNGNGIKGCFETTAVFKDALNSAGFLTKIDKPVSGCIAVYGDYIVNGQKKQGHIGIVTEVSILARH